MFVGRVQDDRRYYEPLNPDDPNLTTVDDHYHSYRTDVQWNNTLHLDDLMHVAALSATDFTFGYEYIYDTVNCGSTIAAAFRIPRTPTPR